MKAQSALSVKEANLKAMTAFIYTQGSATKQMFEHELGLSLPTITQNLRAMEADGLIVKGEMQQSTGGLLHLAFDDEPVGLHGAQILRDGWQAEP